LDRGYNFNLKNTLLKDTCPEHQISGFEPKGDLACEYGSFFEQVKNVVKKD